ncbi:MAG: type I phosphomannose isomerase catalytic subunit [Treponemataceae bacterium]
MKSIMKLNPFMSEKVWGYEQWLVSTLKHGQSTYKEKPLFDVLNKDYPLLIKLIQANDTLSVQVHPNDEYAKMHENSYGKTECWYILEATEDAKLVAGLNDFYSRDELENAIKQNKLDEKLFMTPVKKGDFLYIPAGMVHAICGGLRILEVQQPSDITYRLYDWGRPRELHIEKSLDVIINAPKECLKTQIANNFTTSFSCDFFNLEFLNITNEKDLTPVSCHDMVALFVLDGEGFIHDKNDEKLPLKKEDIFLISQEKSFKITTDISIQLMKIFC